MLWIWCFQGKKMCIVACRVMTTQSLRRFTIFHGKVLPQFSRKTRGYMTSEPRRLQTISFREAVSLLRSSAVHETFLILWHPSTVHYLVYRNPTNIRNVRQNSLVHRLPSYIFKIHCNIIIASKPRSTKRSLPIRVLQRITVLVEEWKTNLMSLPILFHFLCAQHV